MPFNPADCGDGRHIAYTDHDRDVVCRLCRRVLVVGPLGVNGCAYGEMIGYRCSLAVMNVDEALTRASGEQVPA